MAIKIVPVSDLRRPPRTLFERINARILSLRDEPRPHGVRKPAGAREGWRIRVGDHRILYRIDGMSGTRGRFRRNTHLQS